MKDNTGLWQESTKELLPEVYRELEKYNDPMVGVHFSPGIMTYKKFSSLSERLPPDTKFSHVAHLGFNLHPDHRDPIGIYTFPREYVLKGWLKDNEFFTILPYFYIIRPSASARVLNLSQMTEKQARDIFKKMGVDEKYLNRVEMKTGHWGFRFWRALQIFLSGENQRPIESFDWNKLFKKAGYNVIFDDGDGIVHSVEPSQVIYLERRAMDILYSGRKKEERGRIIQKFVEAFPDMRPRMDKEQSILYLFHPEKDVRIKIEFVDIENEIRIHFESGKHQLSEINTQVEKYDKILKPEYFQQIKDSIESFLEEEHPKAKEDVNPLLQKISKTYNIVLKETSRDNPRKMIKKVYQDKNYKRYQVAFYINASRSNENGNNDLYITLKKFLPNREYDYSITGYHVSFMMGNIPDQSDPRKVMEDALVGLEKKAEETYRDDSQKVNSIKKVLRFLKRRVFINR